MYGRESEGRTSQSLVVSMTKLRLVLEQESATSVQGVITKVPVIVIRLAAESTLRNWSYSPQMQGVYLPAGLLSLHFFNILHSCVLGDNLMVFSMKMVIGFWRCR